MPATVREAEFERTRGRRTPKVGYAPTSPKSPSLKPLGRRVFIVTDSSSFRPPFTVGGMERQLSALARELESCGIDVTVIARECPDRRTPPPVREGEFRIEYVRPAPVAKGMGWAALGPNLRYILGTCVRLLRARRKYDALVVSGFRQLALPVALLARLTRKPCIIRIETAWDLNDDLSPESNARIGRMAQHLANGVIRANRRLAFRLADDFVAFSDELEARLRRLGATPRKIRRIPNGVDTAQFAPAGAEQKAALRRALDLPLDRPIFIYTGRICRSKGLLELMDIWERLAARRNALLLLVGSGSESHESCEAQVMQRMSRLPDAIVWRPAVDHVAQYLQAADAFILLSYFETFSLSILEAVSVGLPCIVSDVGCARQVIRHHETGAIVPVHAEPEVVLREIDWLLERAEEWPSMGARGRASVMNTYSLQTVARRYVGLFESAIAAEPDLEKQRHA